jgi:hypothetical protein
MIVRTGSILALLALTAMAAPAQLTDRAIAAYAARPYDKRAMMFHHVVLGLHRGIRVVVDFPCSDVCPDATTQIIHYDLAPGPGCERAGGVTVERMVPVSIAVMRRPFCVPRILASGARRNGGR